MTSGDVVGVTAYNESAVLISGVVIKVETNSIDVAFDGDVSPINTGEDNQTFNLIKLSNDVTHRRIKSALNDLKKYSYSHRLIQTLFGETDFTPNKSESEPEISYFNNDLNDSQKNAIRWSLSQKELAIIHGPPGTGKTTVLIEFILQCVRAFGLRVLATAPSNVAVDNLLEKLSLASDISVVRLGHPARAATQLHKYSLDAVIARSDQFQIVCDMRTEIDSLVKQRKSSFAEIKSLRKELKTREKKVLKQVLSESQVVLSTLTSGSPKHILKQLLDSDGYYPFDVVVIDECSQAMEPMSWIVLDCAHKCVLAGDHMQLPPTIVSKRAANEGLEVSLMERLIREFEDKQIVRMLNIQYRMNELIMKWSSEQFYSNKLEAHHSVKDRSLKDLMKQSNISPLLLIDTAGCDMNELDLEDEESKGNEYEADIVSVYVRRLIESGFDESSIGVITPYNLQVQLIRARLRKYQNIEVKSVDGFQGREKEIIILSLVRSNDSREVGFLSERRRINVAVTRAKRHLTVVCDSETVTNDTSIETLVQYLQQNGDIVCAQDFRDDMQNLTSVERPQHLRFKPKNIPKDKKTRNQNKCKEFKNKKSISKSDENQRNNSLDIERENEFEIKINDFLESSESELIFEPTLNSFERLLVHKICESLNLIHESTGEAQERHIVVKKRNGSESSAKCAKDERKDCDERLPEQRNRGTNQTERPEKKSEKSEIKNTNNSIKTENQNKIKKKDFKQKEKNANRILTLPDTEDLDSLLATIKKSDNTCSYYRCKTNIAVLGQKCQFCGLRFCLTHAMPEIHSADGCGQQIKNQLRSQTRKEGKVFSGSGTPNRKGLDSRQRNYLEKKLNNKLSEMSSERRSKRKDE